MMRRIFKDIRMASYAAIMLRFARVIHARCTAAPDDIRIEYYGDIIVFANGIPKGMLATPKDDERSRGFESLPSGYLIGVCSRHVMPGYHSLKPTDWFASFNSAKKCARHLESYLVESKASSEYRVFIARVPAIKFSKIYKLVSILH